MLTTHITLADKYNYLDAKFQKAFAFLRTADLAALPLGNTPIDGDEVFANVQAYTTLPDEEALLHSPLPDPVPGWHRTHGLGVTLQML